MAMKQVLGSKKRLIAVIAIGFCLFVLMAIGFFFVLPGKDSVSTLSNLPASLGLALLGVIVVWFTPAAILLYRQKPPATEAYDRTRFALFEDRLASVSIGAGIETPSLIVHDTPLPDAFIARTSQGLEVGVGPSLLTMPLTNQEVEAIMAACVAKMIDMRMAPAWSDVHEKLSVSDNIASKMRSCISDPSFHVYCLSVLRADTLAARITGQPDALRSAIAKVAGALKAMPQPVSLAPQPYWFVEPLHTGWKVWNDAFTALPDLRIQNLGLIETGARPAFSELRDGRPVVEPEGWR